MKKQFDFLFGNPDISSPKILKDIMMEVVQNNDKHNYTMPFGYVDTRESISKYLNKRDNLKLSFKSIIMTSGAVGGLNIVLRSIVKSGEEILTPLPYFFGVEQIATSMGVKLTTSQPSTGFHLNLESIKSAITKRTRAVCINTPNNPTGVVYNKDELTKLCRLLEEESKRIKKTIYLISDEVYDNIIYKENDSPSIISLYPNSFIVNSYSKTLSLSGERIGYIVMNPEITNRSIRKKMREVIDFIYYNAPSFFQQVVTRLQGVTIDTSIYKDRRDVFCKELHDLGYEFDIPDGTFYLFVKSPISNDIKFVEILKRYGVLVIPGDYFNYNGYFRISYTTPIKNILNSMEGFKKAKENC